MRNTGVMTIATALLLTATSGCGTMANMDGRVFFAAIAPPSRPPIPFGGAGADVMVIGMGVSHPLRGDGTLIFTTAALIDLPFSLVGDFVTLPWTIYESTSERHHPTGRYDSPWLNASPSTIPDPVGTESPTR